MQVALKIWRYDAATGDKALREYEVDAPEEATLLDCLDLAECMVVSGLARKESRGAHARPHDFPDRDDENFLRHTITTWEDGEAKLDWKPVTMTKWQPQERKY